MPVDRGLQYDHYFLCNSIIIMFILHLELSLTGWQQSQSRADPPPTNELNMNFFE